MPGYLSLTLLDGYARETTKRMEFVDQVLLADYVLISNDFMTELAACTDLQIIRASMVITDGLSLPAQDPAGSNIDVGATFAGFLHDGEGKKATWKLPGVTMSFVGAGGTIDLAQGAIETLLENWEYLHPNSLLLSDGESIDEWITGTLDK